MLFSEANGEWRPIPQWARFLIAVGFGWPRKQPGTRRIALVSMPCDSAGSGLVALGVLIRDLGTKEANEIDGHAKRLVEHAHQFIEHCNRCPLQQCNPLEKKCGQVRKVNGTLRSTQSQYRKVKYSIRKLGPDDECPVWLLPNFNYAGGNMCPTVEELAEFYVDGEPPPEWKDPEGELCADAYSQIVSESQILPQNLRRSYSGLCLAGRAAGEAQTREVCASIRFRNTSREFGLEELLTVHDWSECNVSRACFFNTLTGRLNHSSAVPAIVVADGDASLLKVFDRHEFQQSDIVGVIHRAIERDRLEAVGNKIAAQRQWYDQDEKLRGNLPLPPRGVSVSLLRRRN